VGYGVQLSPNGNGVMGGLGHRHYTLRAIFSNILVQATTELTTHVTIAELIAVGERM
jgi:hypothetical protein